MNDDMKTAIAFLESLSPNQKDLAIRRLAMLVAGEHGDNLEQLRDRIFGTPERWAEWEGDS